MTEAKPRSTAARAGRRALVVVDGAGSATPAHARARALAALWGLDVVAEIHSAPDGLSLTTEGLVREFSADEALADAADHLPEIDVCLIVPTPDALPGAHLALRSARLGTDLVVVIDEWWPKRLSDARVSDGALWDGMLERLAAAASTVVTSSAAQRVSLEHRLGRDVVCVSPTHGQQPVVQLTNDRRHIALGFSGSLNTSGPSVAMVALAAGPDEHVGSFTLRTPLSGTEWFWLRGLRDLPGVVSEPYVASEPARLGLAALDDVVVWAAGFDQASIETARHDVPQSFVEAAASGRPMLVLAPADLKPVSLCIEHEMAEVVTDPELEQVVRALAALADPAHRAMLAERSTAFAARFARPDDLVAIGDSHDALSGPAPHVDLSTALAPVSVPTPPLLPASEPTWSVTGPAPKLTLIMPLLDAMPWVGHALSSLSDQRDASMEVIAVDGGSTDGTRELVAANGHVRMVDAPGLSQTAALNLGFSQARGEIFGWLNGDDILAPGAIPWVLDWFASRPDAGFLYGDSMAINESGRQFGLRSNVKAGQYDDLVKGDFIVQPSAFWRRSVHEAHGPLDETLHYTFDYAFFLDIARDTELHYEPVIFSLERLRGGAKTAQGGSERAEEFVRVMEPHIGAVVPEAFRPEVAAVHAVSGLKRLKRREIRIATKLFRHAVREAKPRSRALAHVVAGLGWGPSGTANARLLSNAVQNRRAGRREKRWPEEELS